MVAAIALAVAGCTGPSGSSGSHAKTHDGPAAASAPPTTSTSRPTQSVPDRVPSGVVDPPPGHGMSRYTRQDLHWQDCRSAEQCATVLAPLNYHKPNGKAVSLAVARKKDGYSRSKPALFTNPGGPGGSGVGFLDGFNSHGLDAHYNIFSWDPRGVGKSTPVHCFGSSKMEKFTSMDSAPQNPKDLRAWEKENVAFGQACLKKTGQLLKHISTADTTRDLNLLRDLFGDKKLNYLGFSYGTSIGAMFATKFPRKVGHMVLDGPTAIGGATHVSQIDGFDRTLDHFAGWCAEQSEQHCRLGHSQHAVLDSVDKLLTKLGSHPIPAGRRDLTQSLGMTGLAFALYSPASQWKILAKGLEKALYEHDGTMLLTWADNYNERDRDGNFGQFNAAFPAIRCLDKKGNGVAGALRQWKRDEKTAPTLGKFYGPDLSCPTWPVAGTGDTQQPISYNGKPPIVLLGTTGDPATPYEYAEHMHKALKSSRLITLKANGHLAFDQSKCVQHQVRAFMMHDKPPKSDNTCTDGPAK